MSFCVYDSLIVLCNGEQLLAYDIETAEEKVISLPRAEIRSHNNEDPDNFHSSVNVTFSDDGNYLVFATNRKQLCLLQRKSLQIISTRTLPRAASKIRFTPKNDIVVADKSGDAYLYSTEEPSKPGQLLLGHLSMLLDILVMKNNKYIVTSDRDEKIRVSMFPNSYNVLSYCLGHEKFVTNVEETNGRLISGGGDAFLWFWNPETGEEVDKIYYGDNFSHQDIISFNEKLKNVDVDESVVSLPLKHLRLVDIDNNCCIVVTSFYCSKKLLLYRLSDGKVSFAGDMQLDEEPLECFGDRNKLWILSDERLSLFEWRGETFVGVENKLDKVTELWKKMRNSVTSSGLFTILYKRKYDNVQEYQERKKIRLNKC